MILKKPYGLLIKHFRLIHFILTLLTIYLMIKTKTVVNFFQDYVVNNYSVTVIDNMASSYISPFIYVALIIVLLSLVALFILLRYKKKPNRFYIITILYYVLLFIMLIVATNLINGLSEGFWETASARQYRDFSNIIYYPQLIFIIILAVRSFGFDIKKFDFKKDLAELDLSEEDSELIELNVGFDVDKIKRTFRRTVRELKYYFLENKFLIICFLIIASAFGIYTIASNYEKVNYRYNQGASFIYNNFNLKVEDSILTNLSYEGKRVSDDNYYLLVKISVTNNSLETTPLDYMNFKVYMKNEYLTPSLDIGSNFIDYAKPYYGESIKYNETKTFLLTYIIKKEDINRKFSITLYNGSALKSENFLAKTIKVDLSPVVINNITIVRNAKLNEQVNFNDTYLLNTTFMVKNYLIGQKYSYKYEKCYGDKCREYSDFITADYSLQNKQTLLVLDYDFSLDETSSYYETSQSVGVFSQNFFKIRYQLDGAIKIVDIKNVTPTNLKDKLILQTNSEIEKAQVIDLYINIRNKSYIINLINKNQ